MTQLTRQLIEDQLGRVGAMATLIAVQAIGSGLCFNRNPDAFFPFAKSQIPARPQILTKPLIWVIASGAIAVLD